jgi:hypothetical protein
MQELSIVEKLERNHGTDVMGEALLCNPDGPEAAAIIKELVAALDEVCASSIRPGSRYKERLAREYERIRRIARAALSRAQVRP